MTDRVYKCPYGCVTQYPITTIRGWKRHMSVKHDRFTDAQLQEAEAGAAGTTSDDVRSRMETFANELDGVPVTISPEGNVTEMPGPTPAPMPEEPAKRKVRATPRKLKKVIAGIPEKILNVLRVTPDDEDKDSIEEVVDFMQELFGVDFEVDEGRTTVRSRWWAWVWFGGAILLIFVKHRGAELLAGPPEPDVFGDKKKDKEHE